MFLYCLIITNRHALYLDLIYLIEFNFLIRHFVYGHAYTVNMLPLFAMEFIRFRSLTLLFVRIAVSFLMFHHGLEKLADVDGFTQFVVDKYFNILPFDHHIWTYIAAYSQLICSIFLVIGLLYRLSLLMLSSTMIFALYFHLIDTGLQAAPLGIVTAHNYEFEPSMLYLTLYIALFVFGSGKFSLSTLFANKITKKIPFWA